ncbi:MAG: hypothetical protein AAFQ82_20740, partial [Myxococcota bacterium]
MAYDSDQQLLFVYGGRATTPTADMWAFDGTTWFELDFIGERPSPLVVNAMTYDRERRRLVLFGSGVWEWDGNGWTEMVASGPEDRSFGQLQYDPVRRRVVLYLGRSDAADCGEGTSFCRDVWEWNGETWTELTPGDASVPEPRDKHGMAFDEERLQTVVFGGSNGPVHPGTWTWGGANWLDQTPATEPIERIRHSMVYDPLDREVWMFGGIRATGDCDGNSNVCGDIWTWANGAWTKRNSGRPNPAPSGSEIYGPPPRHSQAVAFMTASDMQGVLMFGGSRGQVTSDFAPFCPRDAITGTQDCQDTWLYVEGGNPECAAGSTSGWCPVSGFSSFQPSARTRHMMTYDESRNAVVLFGGLDGTRTCDGEFNGSANTCADTWEWGKWGMADDACTQEDEYCWRKANPIQSPPARASHAMVYDKERQRVVLHGGQLADNSEANDTWEWDGQRWTEVTSTQLNPPARFAHGMVYDTARRQVVVFGGSARRDTWELSASPE